MADPGKVDHGPPPPAYPGQPIGGVSTVGGVPPPQYPPPPQYGGQPPTQHQYPPPPQYGGQPPTQPQYTQYAQPYPGQQGAMMTGQHTIIVQQPGLVGVNAGYGPSATTLTCQYCNSNVTTSTSKECGGMVWMVAGIICLVGLFFPLLWLGCCLIPFCIPSLYNTKHTCPNCQRLLGTYRQGGM